MKLKVSQRDENFRTLLCRPRARVVGELTRPARVLLAPNADKDAVTACCWSPANVLYTCSDDATIAMWSMEGESLGKVAALDSFATDMHWVPSVGHLAADTFAVSCSDGACLCGL